MGRSAIPTDEATPSGNDSLYRFNFLTQRVSRLRPHFYLAVARAINASSARRVPHTHTTVDPDFMRSYVVRMLCAKRESIGNTNDCLRLRAREH
jgi:hypothetical protein